MSHSVNNQWIVIKYGGTSVSTIENWTTIAKTLSSRIKEGFKPVLVCSALSGISNLLEKLVIASVTNEHQPILDEIYKRHTELLAKMGIDEVKIFEPVFSQLDRLSQGIFLIGSCTPAVRARILAQGELLSTTLGAAFLKKFGMTTTWMDARELLTTEKEIDAQDSKRYLSGICDYQPDARLQDCLSKITTEVIITQGFIAKNHAGETVLLGRGGSDTSASYFAAKLNAKRLEIWTNVPGMFTANPHQIASARHLLYLDYDEAQELASSGAKVLHPRSIDPVRVAGVPLHILWTENPTHPGTIIGENILQNAPSVKAVSMKTGVDVITLDSIQMWQQAGFLADVFACFKKFGISIDLIATSETNVTVTLNKEYNIIDDQTLDNLIEALGKFCTPKVIGPCTAINLVGKNIRSILHKLAPAFSVFEDKKIFLISQAASDLNFTFVVDEKDAPKILGTLHELFFSSENDAEKSIFGAQWNEIHSDSDQKMPKEKTIPWWESKRDHLLNFAKNTTPAYIYDLETIKTRINDLKSIKAVDRFHYAVKANANPEILNLLHREGIHFDCVSTEEIQHLMNVVPNLNYDKILFTPNFASIEEYKFALEKNCIVTLDNVHPLEHHTEIFKNSRILIRVDSGIAKGHHPHVMTSGPKSKFGVSHEELDRVRELAKTVNATIIGLHAHVGSGILTAETWAETAHFLAEVASAIGTIEILDLGGGLGIPEKTTQTPLNIEAVENHLQNFKDQRPQFKLWMEPGRFLVAESGVLLTKVTQLKSKSGKNFIGIDTGMNSLIRPALYGSWHQIVNLTKLHEPATVNFDIVGPICESGDVLGHDRMLPETHENDIILIATAGAYGKVMSSGYNLRIPAQEYLLET